MLSKLYRSYPVVKDKTDDRDMTLPAPELTQDQAALKSVDLRPFCGPIKDQGQTSSCTGHAASSMREFLYRKYFDNEHDKSVKPEDFVLSPFFIYFKERAFEGDTNQDAGAQMRTAAKMLNNVGSCLIKDDPYLGHNLYTTPTPKEVNEALLYKSGAYHRLADGLETMKSVLKSGYTFIAGITVFESFEDNYTARTGTMLIPNPAREKNLGGHALHFVGFDDAKQHLIVQNSWGTGWGDKGYFYMPYSFASNINYMSDCWVNHLGKAWGTQEEIAEVIKDSDRDVAVQENHEQEHEG